MTYLKSCEKGTGNYTLGNLAIFVWVTFLSRSHLVTCSLVVQILITTYAHPGELTIQQTHRAYNHCHGWGSIVWIQKIRGSTWRDLEQVMFKDVQNILKFSIVLVKTRNVFLPSSLCDHKYCRYCGVLVKTSTCFLPTLVVWYLGCVYIYTIRYPYDC